MHKYVIVMLGGGAGSMVRFIVGSVIAARYSGRFPLGTFLINVTGSCLIGILMTLFTQRVQLHPNWRFGLVVGFLGGYTTFSSFEWESFLSSQDGNGFIALLYILSSVAAGYGAVWLGALIVGRR